MNSIRVLRIIHLKMKYENFIFHLKVKYETCFSLISSRDKDENRHLDIFHLKMTYENRRSDILYLEIKHRGRIEKTTINDLISHPIKSLIYSPRFFSAPRGVSSNNFLYFEL